MVSFVSNLLNSLKDVSCNFAQALTVSDILTFKIVDIQKVGQGHVVQFSQLTISWQMSKSTYVSHTFSYFRDITK